MSFRISDYNLPILHFNEFFFSFVILQLKCKHGGEISQNVNISRSILENLEDQTDKAYPNGC